MDARRRAILVTGATGNVGGAVAAALAARGVRARLAVRVAGERVTGDAPAVVLDFLDGRTFGPALEGCAAVFLMRPPAIAKVRQTLLPFVDAARAHGVRQIVFLSVAGRGRSRLVPHYAVEDHLHTERAGWTILRAGFFAQNFGGPYRRDIVGNDWVYVPAGRGRVAFIDVRDLGEVAADALIDPEAHRRRTYTLTGPEALTFREAAERLSAQVGRTVRYEPASVPGYAWHLWRQGAPGGLIAVQTALHVGLRFGQAAAVDDTLPRLLGRAPRTLLDYFRDHRTLWQRAPAGGDTSPLTATTATRGPGTPPAPR